MFHGCPFEILLNEVAIHWVVFNGFVMNRTTPSKVTWNLFHLIKYTFSQKLSQKRNFNYRATLHLTISYKHPLFPTEKYSKFLYNIQVVSISELRWFCLEFYKPMFSKVGLYTFCQLKSFVWMSIALDTCKVVAVIKSIAWYSSGSNFTLHQTNKSDGTISTESKTISLHRPNKSDFC